MKVCSYLRSAVNLLLTIFHCEPPALAGARGETDASATMSYSRHPNNAACDNGPEMLRTVPPFRADHVGSLLRPAQLREARARHERREIDAAELKSIADRAIQGAIARQEATGLRGVTDGE